MDERQCPFCGKLVRRQLAECPFCKERLPEVRAADLPPRDGGGRQIRRGLLYMLLALVVHYFAGGYSPLRLPLLMNPVVTMYLSPLLFLSGLSLSLYGVYRHVSS
jgi:hypothetical protein